MATSIPLQIIINVIVYILGSVLRSYPENPNFKSAETIVKENGYPIETHEVVTEDGYILVLHRIPHGKNPESKAKKIGVVLLVHGAGANSACFLVNNYTDSLGYLLAEKGYDVWAMNTRGNGYSKYHKTIDSKTNPKEFYDYSFEDMGYYDLPACIDYVLKETKASKLFYISHSQGGTVFYTMASRRPEYNKKIRLASLMAPSAIFLDMPSGIIYFLATHIDALHAAADSINLYHLPVGIVKAYADALCPVFFNTCKASISAGFDNFDQMTKSLTLKFLETQPAIIALKQLYHYAQLITNGGYFRRYDYGSAANLKIYGQNTPPEFPLKAITCPVAYFHSDNDLFISVRNIDAVIAKLPNVVLRYIIKNFTHLDHIIAKDVYELEYKKLLETMSKF